jgi:hypothetical protein
MGILKTLMLSCESSLATLQVGFTRRKACKLALKPEVVQLLLLL